MAETNALANYKIYRNDRNHANQNAYTTIIGGGTQILITNPLPNTQSGRCGSNLPPERGEKTLIISIYTPPSLIIHNSTRIIDILMNPGFPLTITMGDFKAKLSSWGCDVDNSRGTTLKDRVLAPPTPATYGYNSVSTLDFAITLNADWTCTVTSRSELSSDHNPIMFDFISTTHFFFLPNKRYTHMKTNWEKFAQNLTVPDNFTLSEANTPEDIDEQIAAFTDPRLH
ncbi:hypothetical protein TNCV_922031 [Trichonephila clavipes]|nr:hypothetical protein TNCV_922031 [Trichonephila clavipes]